MKLLLASNNAKKRRELERILEGTGLEVLTPGDTGIELDPDECGSTFAENARIKALEFAEVFDGPVLADDSGLSVDALDGRPGVHSARYAGEGADDEANRRRLLEELADTPTARRTARFECHVVLARGAEVLAEAHGACEGSIIESERGDGGFGYDPLFLHGPNGLTFAELPADRKDGISHRGRALRELSPELRALTRQEA